MPSRQAANLNNLKQTPIPVVSPRTPIVNEDGTVTRTGQLLLEQLQASEVLQGTHGGRPSPGDAPDGALYVESDRTVLYANINGDWHYIAGTMWGTLSPDQRPTDLGVNDAGFDFRTVDQPAREFIWSQAYWVEVTPARFGTHAQRLAVNVARVIEQMLWVETDRTVLYQLLDVGGAMPVWQYIAGTMWGTLSPDQRPTDLGTHDAGFTFRGTDQQRSFIWSQTAWVETTPPSNSLQFAQATGAVTLTSSNQPIPGTSLTLAQAGTYLITAVFDFQVQGATSSTSYCLGSLSAPGSSAAQDAIFVGVTTATSQTARATVSQQYIYQPASAGQVVYLQALVSGGSAAAVAQNHTTITAQWISP